MDGFYMWMTVAFGGLFLLVLVVTVLDNICFRGKPPKRGPLETHRKTVGIPPGVHKEDRRFTPQAKGENDPMVNV